MYGVIQRQVARGVMIGHYGYERPTIRRSVDAHTLRSGMEAGVPLDERGS